LSEGCIFCKIVRKEAEAAFVYEDDKIVAFMDMAPASPGHLLVVTKQHYENIYEVPDDLLAYVIVMAKRIGMAARKALNADGLSFFQTNERGGGQEVFHFHFHVIPRYRGVSLKIVNREKISLEEREKYAERIREVLKDFLQ